MFVHLKEQWRPEAVELSEYADDCEYWRLGVSLHVLQQNMTDVQRQRVEMSEFKNSSDYEEFKAKNDQSTILCQSSTSSSEITEQLLRDCLLKDPAIANVDYLIYCHNAIDLEFYSTPACRAQNALQNQKIIPLSLSSSGSAAGLVGLEMGNVLGQESDKGVVIALNDLGIMPARRRILDDVLVNDAGGVLHLVPRGAGLRIVACETTQYSTHVKQSQDLMPAIVDLLHQAESHFDTLDELLVVLPKYSSHFKQYALANLPEGPSYVFECSDVGYSGVNFAYNALQLFEQSANDSALIIQVSETGAGVYCVVGKDL